MRVVHPVWELVQRFLEPSRSNPHGKMGCNLWGKIHYKYEGGDHEKKPKLEKSKLEKRCCNKNKALLKVEAKIDIKPYVGENDALKLN